MSSIERSGGGIRSLHGYSLASCPGGILSYSSKSVAGVAAASVAAHMAASIVMLTWAEIHLNTRLSVGRNSRAKSWWRWLGTSLKKCRFWPWFGAFMRLYSVLFCNYFISYERSESWAVKSTNIIVILLAAAVAELAISSRASRSVGCLASCSLASCRRVQGRASRHRSSMQVATEQYRIRSGLVGDHW